ncbi:MAG TPA: GPW/gp25 family protein [Acidimicrobiales bacterium]|nr:GPW/gp25 family protein [Acidimicrobiales bacterium]
MNTPRFPSPRSDYAFPLRLTANRGAQAPYSDHVQQMLVQLLLTSPGERVNLPTFGCGLRQLLFAGQSAALSANVGIQVRQAVKQWLGDQVSVHNVDVLAGATAPPGSGLDQGQVLVTLSYVLVDTQAASQVSVVVG